MLHVTLNNTGPALGLYAGIKQLDDEESVTIEWGNDIKASWRENKESNPALIMRLLTTKPSGLVGSDELERTEIDQYIFLSDKIQSASSTKELERLEHDLNSSSYLVGQRLTLADLAVFGKLVGMKESLGSYVNLNRYYRFIESIVVDLKPSNITVPLFASPTNSLQGGGDVKVKKLNEKTGNKNQSSTSGKQQQDGKGNDKSNEKKQGGKENKKPPPAKGSGNNGNNNNGGSGDREKKKDEGKFVELPGAEMGKVVVRFPPEASGFLHIGHAKAALLNQYYQQMFKGTLIMRFDDTNPAKENVEFEKVILEDVELLQIKYDKFSYTSDHFELLLDLCEKLIKEGKAYVDDTDPEIMKQERADRIESKSRSNSVAKNLELWNEMKQGSPIGQKCCVRAKINMNSLNGCMRDPAIYRCKDEAHPRTGHKYKVYPTYDFACPIVDSIEGVTHALRTTEYIDRDEQYYWFTDALNLRKPYIYSYSRLNLVNTVLSKRKLTWFVDSGHVDGWDDPRFPTVRGVLRRGMTVEGLKQFIVAQGSSKSVNMMEWDKIWAFNRKVVDPIAPRHTAVLRDTRIPMVISGVTEGPFECPAHPKNPDVGTRKMYKSSTVFVEEEDALLFKEGDSVTLMNWGNVLIKSIKKDSKTGKIEQIEADNTPDNTNFKNTLKITWLPSTSQSPLTPIVVVYYDNIISKAVLGKDEDFKQYVATDTKKFEHMLADEDLASIKKGDIVQLQRKGFFICDEPLGVRSPTSFKQDPLVLIYVPDGKPTEAKAVNKAEAAQAAAGGGKVETAKSVVASGEGGKIKAQIEEQGNKVRDLKAQKASKDTIQAAVKTLLELKAKYKEVTGQEYVPGATPVQASTPVSTSGSGEGDKIRTQIDEQGNKVRDLKAQKASKDTIQAAVKTLLELKAKYKEVTGQDYVPGAAPTPVQASAPVSAGGQGDQIRVQIDEQGNKVRDLKAQKASKDAIQAAVKILLELKAKYKEVTGQDYVPGAAPTPVQASTPVSTSGSGEGDKIRAQVDEQGNKVRDLKAQKASKDAIQAAVKALLDLKAKYKEVTGQDYVPGAAPTPVQASAPVSAGGQGDQIRVQIDEQGNKVRDLKAQKASKDAIQAAVKILLELKAKYKEATGQDYVPGAAPTPVQASTPVSTSGSGEGDKIRAQVDEQGNKVRDLKAQKASKDAIQAAVKALLDLKAKYKEVTGQEYTPGAAPAPVKQTSTMNANTTSNSGGDEIKAQIEEQGNKVRDLKSAKATKDAIDEAVKTLLSLKAKYKEVTGQDYVPAAAPGNANRNSSSSTKKEKKENKPPQAQAPKAEKGDGGPKKQTRLGLEAKKSENLSDWYSQVITKSEMIEYYDVSGCYIFRPWSYAIWEIIMKWFDTEIKKLGVQNAYFPMFVSQAALEREKNHIADFAPEVAWVTKSGDTDLAEPVAIRPTSETVMYPSYAKWIQSYRDLPLKLNQWNSVVRWEFKHPQPFLRTREFLWQEGHSAFATYPEAEEEVYKILDLYEKIYTYLMAIPVIPGKKTEKEKFPGGDYTTTVEAFVSASGRGLQGATSHHLGQNFSKMFEIVFEDPETKEKRFAYQNSWGLSTRTIGAMVMIHGDDQGLVLPPRIASVQVVIIPCGITATLSEADKKSLLEECQRYTDRLAAAGIRVKLDDRDNYSPGWKFNHWELKGVPIRFELGPKDVKENQYVTVRRDTGEKATFKKDTAETDIQSLLDRIHDSMYNKVKKELDEHTIVTEDWKKFCTDLDKKNIIMSPFCGAVECEEKIKKDSARDEPSEPGAPAMGAKSLCVPFKQPKKVESTTPCIHPECKSKAVSYTLFGRSY